MIAQQNKHRTKVSQPVSQSFFAHGWRLSLFLYLQRCRGLARTTPPRRTRDERISFTIRPRSLPHIRSTFLALLHECCLDFFLRKRESCDAKRTGLPGHTDFPCRKKAAVRVFPNRELLQLFLAFRLCSAARALHTKSLLLLLLRARVVLPCHKHTKHGGPDEAAPVAMDRA